MDYSPEQPPASPPPTSPDDAGPLAQLADAYQRQAAAAESSARSTKLRERVKSGAIAVLAVALAVALVRIDGRASRAVTSSDRTLSIAQGFQCQQAASTGQHVPGCPPVRPGAPSAVSQTQGAVDQIVWRIRAGVALEDGQPLPPRPADVPPSVAP